MDVFSLFARIGLDTSDYDKGLNDASGKTHSFGEKLKSGLATAAKMGAVAITAITTATTAMTTALVKGVSETAAYGDNIDKMSQKMGMSAQAYQEWDAVMQHSGTSIESLQAGMKTLANAVESGNKAFDRLGITQEQITSMNNEELFSATITALQNVENETERTYLAGQLLGRGATELGALLNTSAEDTQAMKDRVHELGGVLSDEAVKNAAKFQDSLQDMQTAISGVGRSILSDFMPGLTDLMDGFTRMITGEDYADELIASGIGGIATAIEGSIGSITSVSQTIIPTVVSAATELLPMVGELGTGILSSLSTAIIDNLPDIISAGSDILLELITSIISALPELANAATEIVSSLVNSLSQSLPELIPAAVEALTTIVQGLIDNLPMLLDGALQLVQGLADGILEALPVLIEALPELIQGIVDFLIEGIPMLIDAAISIIDGIVAALPDIIQALIDALPSIIESLVSGLISCIGALVQGAIQLVVALVTHMPEIIASLIEAIPDIITSIIDGFVDGLGSFVECGGQIMDALWQGIQDIWDSMVTWFTVTIPELIGNIGTWFSELPGKVGQWFTELFNNVKAWGSDMWNKAKQIAKDFVDKFVKFIKELPGKLGKWLEEAISNVTSFASDLWDKAVEAGGNLVKGLWDGITGLATWLWDQVSSWASGIWDGICGIFGIHSPSRKMAWAGEMLVKGLAGSIDENGDEAVSAAENMSENILKTMDGLGKEMENAISSDLFPDEISSSVKAYSGQGRGTESGLYGSSVFHITINGAKYSDEQSLARAVAQEIQYMTERRSAAFATA